MKVPAKVDLIKIEWLNELEIAVFTKRKHFRKFVKDNQINDKTYINEWDINNGFATILVKKKIPFFLMGFKCKSERIIIHECVHMVYYVLSNAGIELNTKTDEIYAYMIDYLFRKVKDILK